MEDKAAKEEERVLKALNEAAQKDQKLQAEKKGEEAEKEEKSNNNEKTKNSKQADNKTVKKTDNKNKSASKSTNKKTGSKSSKEIQKELEEQIEKKRKITAEVTAIIIACVSVLTIIGVYFGGGGLIGQGISAFLKGIVGFGAYILPLLLIGVCFYVFFSENKVFSASKAILSLSMFFVLITFLHLIHINSKNPIHYDSFALFTKEMYKAGNYYNGGLFGAYIGSLLYKAMGKASSIIFVVMGFVCLGIFLTGQSFFDGIKRLWGAFSAYFVFEEKELAEELLEEESAEEEKLENKNNIFKSLKNKLKPKKKAVLSEEENQSVREKVKEQIRQEKKNEQSLEKNEEQKHKPKKDDKEVKKEEKKIYREIPKPTIIDIKPENRNKPNHRLNIALDTVLTAERAKLEPAKMNKVETNLPEFIKNREKFAYEKFLEDGQNKPKINGLEEATSKQYVDSSDGGYVIEEAQANSVMQEQRTEPTIKEELSNENNSNIIDDSNIGEYFIDVSGLHQNGEHFFEPTAENNYATSVTEAKLENNEPKVENQTNLADEIPNRPISRREQLEMLINSDDDFEEEFEEYNDEYYYEEKEDIENINNIEKAEIAEANGSEEMVYSEEMSEEMENEPIDISNLNIRNEEFSELDLKTEETALRAEEEDLPPWEDSYDEEAYQEAYSTEENMAREALKEIQEQKKPIESYQSTSNSNSFEKRSENSSQKVSNMQEPVIIKAEETKTVDKLNVEPKAEYVFPKLEFLGKNPNLNNSKSSEIELLENSKILVKTLASFNVDATVIEISKGPAVTRYELSIADGIKVSKILNLADNLALSLAATSIRIEAPIPGKAAVGIEIPNKEVTSVYLSEVVCDEKFQKFPSKLAFGLGKDIAGNVVVTNIAKMPHMLIAGATGSGKSVCINTLITSILYKSSPDEVRLIMVDPKVVELSVYNGIPHLLIPVVTEADKASGALNWAVHEMMERYNKFAQTRTRNLEGYNKLLEEKGEQKLPQIVIIIDELADLMMVAAKEVEASICRLAQLARAAGLHLIIATQRPSVDVITGLIKANIPSRIAFAVSSGTDSRTIIDTVGAEKLLGKGDMLFKAVDMNKPLRVQGAFVTDSEVERIVSFLKENNPVEYDQEVINKIATMKGNDNTSSGGSNDVSDEMTDEVIAFIVRNGKCSTSLIQRKFRLGYNRAARIVEELEDRGIIGPENGSKPREVLMDKYQMEEYFTRNAGY